MAEESGFGGEKEHSEKSHAKKKVTTNTVVPYYKLFSFADSSDYILMILGTIAAIGNGLCLPLVAVLFGELTDSFGQNANTDHVVHDVSKVSLKYVYLALGSGFASFLQVVCWTVTGERQAARIRNLYLKTILRQDIRFFDKNANTGDIVNRMSGDTILIQDAMGEKVGKFINPLASFLGGFVTAFAKGWLLTLVIMSSIPPLLISTGIMSTILAKLASRGQAAYSEAANVVDETIGSIRTVASFTGERQAIARYDKSLSKAYKTGVQGGLSAGMGVGVFMCVIYCSYALAVWFGAKMILDRDYNGGDVLIVILAMLNGSFSLGQVFPCMNAFAAGQSAAFKMFETINRKSEIDPYNHNGLKLDDIRGGVELRDVYFSYPARPDEPILSGFSLSIPSGITTALVGPSGSGKSTVISLIERFYDPQAGEILIDGINLKEFQLRWIRGKIGLVSQEPVLFTSSIRDNIAYGKDGATIEEIKVAAELANATKFIDKLPQGLDTMVGEHGTQLSGGQKQRIAIARAILKDPRILLLDEATSALDVESERTVQEALDRVMINRTTVIVAHRLSTVKNADMIVVIHQGKIVEKGVHSELLENLEGAYHQLIQLQVLGKDRLEQHLVVDDEDKVEISVDSVRDSSSQQMSPSSISVSSGVHTTAAPQPTETGESRQPEEASLHRLAYLNKPEIPALLVGSVGAVATGVILPINGLLLSSMVKTFYESAHQLRRDSEFWASMFVVLGVGSLVAYPIKSYFFAVAGCKLIRRIRLMFFEKVVHMEISWFDKPQHTSGAIGARLSSDATYLRGLVGDTLGLVVQNTATAAVGLFIGFQASWQLALIILVMLPLVGLNGYVQTKFTGKLSSDAKNFYEDAIQVASNAVGNIRTVASFCAEEKVVQLFRKKCEGPIRAGMRQGLISGATFGLSTLLLYLFYATAFYAGARLIEEGKITFGQVFRVFFGLIMSAIAISQTIALAPDTSKAKSAAASIFSVLDQESRIDSNNESGATFEIVNGDIEFRHVSFKYPARPDVQIFRDLCLAIRSGRTIALVGESGSGKSTVISLLQRFYEPESGEITLDGVEIHKLNLKWLRQQIGLVSQEPVLFNDTVKANIAYGKQGNTVATEAEILAAAGLANAHSFISGLQHGYDTMVGERGIQLSGGQKQRVAIARAIVKAPKILLLDEATSALDAESEKVVQDALDRVMVDRTAVVVAHRLSTIKDADLIAVVKNGVIAEKGKHETLITIKDGIYASLVAIHSTTSTTTAS